MTCGMGCSGGSPNWRMERNSQLRASTPIFRKQQVRLKFFRRPLLTMKSPFTSAPPATPQPPEGEGTPALLPSPDTLASEEAVDVALGQLDAERARYQAIIDGFAAAEQ